MSSTAITMDSAEKLHFAESESRAVGLFGGMKRLISDNAPRIVGTMKLAGDIAFGLSLNPWLIGYTAFAGVGRILLMIYGTKENQKKVAEKHKDNSDAKQTTIIGKVLHPREYPVEASSGLSVVAESLGVGYGISRFFAGATGFTQTILGAFAVWSYASILLGRDKKAEEDKKAQELKAPWEQAVDDLVFEKSHSQAKGLTGRVGQFAKDHPELMGNLMLLTITAGLLVGGILESYPPSYIIGASILLVANTIQALFVRKRKFNLDGAQEEQGKPVETFQERLQQQRDSDPGVQLA